MKNIETAAITLIHSNSQNYFPLFSPLFLLQWPIVSLFVKNYSRVLVPTLLIPLGLYILSDSIVWPYRH